MRSASPPTLGSSADARIRALHRARPRSRFLRASLLFLAVLLAGSWFLLEGSLSDFVSDSSLDYAEQVLTQEVRPKPLRGQPWDWGTAASWVGDLLQDHGLAALLNTLAIAVLAIVLAWFLSLPPAFLAARTFTDPDALLAGSASAASGARTRGRVVRAVTRSAFILLRSLPEFILAFLFLAIFGRTAWPAVLALAVHNLGILGRLNSEVVENLPTGRMAALRGMGATRPAIALGAVWPLALPRWLLYFFYRWETCVREATVLGVLGLAGLGYYIQEADAHEREDLLVVYILLGAFLVIAGDLLSALARRWIRRAA